MGHFAHSTDRATGPSAASQVAAACGPPPPPAGGQEEARFTAGATHGASRRGAKRRGTVKAPLTAQETRAAALPATAVAPASVQMAQKAADIAATQVRVARATPGEQCHNASNGQHGG